MTHPSVLERTALTVAVARLGGTLTFSATELADYVNVGVRFERAAVHDGFVVAVLPTGAVERALLFARDLARMGSDAPREAQESSMRAYGAALAALSPAELATVAEKLATTRSGVSL